jgi:hypothetical protein
MDYRRIVLIFALVVILLNPPPVHGGDVGVIQPVPAAELYFVDAHSQADEDVNDLDLIIRRMDATGVYRTILAAPPPRSPLPQLPRTSEPPLS